MLVRIGEHLGDLDGQTFGRLPAGWSILYSLSLLVVAAVKRLINEGVIHPGLSWREARGLVAKHRGEQSKRKSRKVGCRLRSFREFVLGTLDEWTDSECELAAVELAQLAERITASQRQSQLDQSMSAARWSTAQTV